MVLYKILFKILFRRFSYLERKNDYKLDNSSFSEENNELIVI